MRYVSYADTADRNLHSWRYSLHTDPGKFRLTGLYTKPDLIAEKLDNISFRIERALQT